MTYSYACADGEGTQTCPGKIIAETEKQVWNLMELRATIAHEEDTNAWYDETRTYLKPLIKTV